ncbi:MULTISPECIES: GNAT family N-acetyltransferase [Catenuloplanes]|uniref:Ribosomal protein S18 acetylase RimI-like enzyme n=1 Tax=Catenuloplanes niger TaxID=587534 RepID=A0AAE3ZWM0_9ACTN|nr:GNAT family N-acetyltransferase [Catenuloplanes niger]MDR7327247.1 ribosomal protein S18 acetylase RimI-like enzyme [Catenuloplanes niger]
MPTSTSRPRIALRPGTADDAASIGALHADSWRRHYRGAYADSYLDGELVAERQAVWSARLADPAGTETIIACRGEAEPIAGFAHVVLDHDPVWGSLVDNLHVSHDLHRAGIGRRLLAEAARAVVRRAATDRLHLWVLEQNVAAQRFYLALGAQNEGRHPVTAAGAGPSRLVGTPAKFRMAWPDASTLAAPGA